MEQLAHKTLIVACGALAKEIFVVKNNLAETGNAIDLQCLPAGYHNTPQNIVPGVKSILDERAQDYDRVLIGYGDCGTGGALDALLKDYPNTERMPGAHCYAFYMGLPEFDAAMEEELGSFFLTDYLVRHFDTLIIKGMGLDRFPDLRDSYFKHYKRLIYIAQTEDADLQTQAKRAADRLALKYEYRRVGYGELATSISNAIRPEVQHA